MSIRVHLNGSRYLACALVGAAVGSVCVLIPLDLPAAAKFAIAAAVVLALARGLWRAAALQGSRAVIAVELHDDDRISLQTRDGEWHDGRILGTTYTTPLLTVLNIRQPGRLRTRHVVIASDSAQPEELRRMRVWLRWGYRRGADKTTRTY